MYHPILQYILSANACYFSWQLKGLTEYTTSICPTYATVKPQHFLSSSFNSRHTCSTRHSLSTCFWYCFMQSSARWKCALYLDNSFWYCGAFFNIWLRSRMLALSDVFILFDSANCFSFFVTCLENEVKNQQMYALQYTSISLVKLCLNCKESKTKHSTQYIVI